MKRTNRKAVAIRASIFEVIVWELSFLGCSLFYLGRSGILFRKFDIAPLARSAPQTCRP